MARSQRWQWHSRSRSSFRRTSPSIGVKRYLRRLHVEALEDRRMLAVGAFDSLWQSVDSFSAALSGQPTYVDGKTSYLQVEEFGAFSLDRSQLNSALAAAPMEFTADTPIEIALPTPDGGLARFEIFESPIMAPELAAKFPEIKTFSGQGIDDPSARVRFDITPAGLHAQVLSPSGSWSVDPYYHLDGSLYASYYASAAIADGQEFNEESPEALLDLTDDLVTNSDLLAASGTQSADGNDVGINDPSAAQSGSELRTYRIAVAATGEYTAFHGGTVADGQAAIVTAINRVSGIFEAELSIRLELIANNDQLIYTDAETDPYTNSGKSMALGQNQTNIDNTIGDANYDIGHVFGTGYSGGIASSGSAGRAGVKARGVSGTSPPVGDSLWVHIAAHEIGHQFGAHHTFNGDSSGCSFSNHNGSTAYEPGSGSTILAYAGVCGNDNLQSKPDPYFHSISFDQIINHIDNVIPAIGTHTANGNNVPTVDAGLDYVIPSGTPFALTASGTDSDVADVLTYSWEQRDLGPQQDVNAGDNGSSPLFRSFTPTTDPTRTFPLLDSLLNNTTIIGETLPTTTRELNFRATVRDNRAGGGGVNSDDMKINVIDTGSPFMVTSHNNIAGVTLLGLTTQTITWDVAGTTANGINTANVNILLSMDGGNTFTTTLASGVTNDGSYEVVLPDVNTSAARFKVEGAGNIFFDVSNVDFGIGTTAPAITVDSLFTYDSTPAITGTVTYSETTIRVDVGNQLGLVAINHGDGTWTLPGGALSPLPDGVYDVVATATHPITGMGVDATIDELTIAFNPTEFAFSNDGSIQIPGVGSTGIANPYPSEIVVALLGTVIDVNVTINDFSHTSPTDVDLLLVGPEGQNVLLMSDVGGSSDVNDIDLTLDDEAIASLSPTGTLTSGLFQPTNDGAADTFPAPAPGGPYGAALAVFDGTNPNGTWSLYVLDDSGDDLGEIANGWSLTITVSSLIVDNTGDEDDGIYTIGDLSLREAVLLANDEVQFPGLDTITFSPLLSGETIILGGSDIDITDAIMIDATALADNVIIDANQQSRIFDIDEPETTAENFDVTLAGLTLTGGRITSGSGGAIRFSSSGNLTLTDSTLRNNNTDGNISRGGAIFTFSGAVTLTGSILSNNSTLGLNQSKGGAIFSSSGAVTLTNSTLSGNSTTGTSSGGGAIASYSGAVTLTNSTLSGNSTTGQFSGGGAIWTYSSAVTLTNSTLSGNSTSGNGQFSGGGAISSSGAVTLSNSTVSGNSTLGNSSDGGGIYVRGAVTLDQSTVTDNHANHANSTGGGIWNDNDLIEITNSILAGNTAGGGSPDLRPGTGIFDVNYSLIGTSITPGAGANNVVADNPLLGPLINYGGPTETHALLFGSLALDAGDPNIVFNSLEFDQRGAPFARVSDTRIDIGAFEFQPLTLIVSTTDDVSDNDFSPGNFSLREAIELANGNAGAYSIVFSSLFDTPQTINLASQLPTITDDLTISGPGADLLALDGGDGTDNTFNTGNGFRIFNVDDGTGAQIDVNISGLTLTGGDVAGNGGAIFNRENLTVAASTLSGNSASSDGGGIYSNDGTLNVTSSTISGNSAGFDGGGIFSNTNLSNETTTITSSTISGNMATNRGGGIFNFDGLTVIQSSSITANTAPAGLGSGVASFGDSVTRTEVTGSIIAGNTNEDVAVTNTTINSFQSGGFNLIGSGGGTLNTLDYFSQTGDQTGVDPLLGPLQDNGGTTLTHALLPGSPAIDAGVTPIHLYHFDGDAIDSNGANNGALQGGLLVDDPGAPFISPTGVEFVDNWLQFIDLANPLTIGSTSSTIEAWVNIPIGADGFMAVLSNFNFNSGSIFWGTDTTGTLRLNWNNSEVAFNGTTDLRDGQWHHIAYVRDTVANELRLYVDGELDASSASAGTNVVFGSTPRIGNSLTGNDPFEGTIDELAIFDQALSAEAIGVRARVFDQRGVGFARVSGTAIDMGAYEEQALPSADFVDDDIINGLDFLAWQRGFGITTGATRADGDADNDGEVGASDLVIWKTTFGQVETTPLVTTSLATTSPAATLPIAAPLVAAVTSEEIAAQPIAVFSVATPVETAELPVPLSMETNSIALADAALAWFLGNLSDEAEVVLIDEATQFDEIPADTVFASKIHTIAPIADVDDSFVVSDDETNPDNSPWLTEELLESVFG